MTHGPGRPQNHLSAAPHEQPEDGIDPRSQMRKMEVYLRKRGLEPSSVELQPQTAGHDISPYLVVVEGALPDSFPVLRVALGAWLKVTKGRAVGLEVHGAKRIAQSTKEMRELLLELAEEIRPSNQSERVLR